MPFIPGILPPPQPQRALWFAFHQNQLLVQQQDEKSDVPYLVDLAELGLTSIRRQYLGQLNGRPCYAAELPPDSPLPEGMACAGLRQLYGHLEDELFWIAGRAVQIVNWDRNHQFCGRCGEPMVDKRGERAKECLECGLISYPRISPAIIVAITRGDEILLARSARHPAGFYSVLAGFVEPGETLEECVRREIREEVGLEVRDIRYFGSQPWPFPNSLMVGFTAVYAGGEIVPEEAEIEDARWFRAGELPHIPGSISISRQLIDWFVARHNGTEPQPGSENFRPIKG